MEVLESEVQTMEQEVDIHDFLEGAGMGSDEVMIPKPKATEQLNPFGRMTATGASAPESIVSSNQLFSRSPCRTLPGCVALQQKVSPATMHVAVLLHAVLALSSLGRKRKSKIGFD